MLDQTACLKRSRSLASCREFGMLEGIAARGAVACVLVSKTKRVVLAVAFGGDRRCGVLGTRGRPFCMHDALSGLRKLESEGSLT